MWKHEIGFRETGSHDFVREADGRLQLDQGDVVTAEESRVRLGVDLGGLLLETAYLPDEKCAPVLVHNDVRRVREYSTVLCLCQAVLAKGHSVLP